MDTREHDCGARKPRERALRLTAAACLLKLRMARMYQLCPLSLNHGKSYRALLVVFFGCTQGSGFPNRHWRVDDFDALLGGKAKIRGRTSWPTVRVRPAGAISDRYLLVLPIRPHHQGHFSASVSIPSGLINYPLEVLFCAGSLRSFAIRQASF